MRGRQRMHRAPSALVEHLSCVLALLALARCSARLLWTDRIATTNDASERRRRAAGVSVGHQPATLCLLTASVGWSLAVVSCR
jgi:hypothetical protein